MHSADANQIVFILRVDVNWAVSIIGAKGKRVPEAFREQSP